MDLHTITRYIAAWAWQIISINFLLSALICMALPRNTMSIVFYIGFFMIFVYCEYMSFKRKKEIFQNGNESA